MPVGPECSTPRSTTVSASCEHGPSEARSILAEHGDKAARAIMIEALADVGDMPQNREIAFARAELARAYMVAGSPDESISWADMVLRDPASVDPIVLLETLITKATSQIQLGVLIEAEVTLRGAIVVADRLGNPDGRPPRPEQPVRPARTGQPG